MAQLPNLRVDICTEAPHAIVRLDGELDIASSDLLVQHLSGLLSEGYTQIVIDLTHLVFCDAAGLGAFVRIGRLVAARGGWLRMAGAQPRMTRIMSIARLTRMLPGYTTAQDALTG
jgi:anti-sigma B factor antagonist